MTIINNLTFTDELIGRIVGLLEGEPKISRRRLSLRICEWMDWRSPGGKFREMSCRKALLELERRGAFKLPVKPSLERACGLFERKSASVSDLLTIECGLDELGSVELVTVRGGGGNSRIWNALLDRHHYLGSGPLCGAQIRYLIWSERFGCLGGLSFSASAWQVRVRDEHIGWGEEAQRHNRQLVVNNSRFLIPPQVKVPNLASHILSCSIKRLADDWQTLYGYRPILLETFVERGRFSGACYRAANWIHVGATTGRGRQDTGTTKKDVYLYGLCTDWKNILCSLPDGRMVVRAEKPSDDGMDWTEEEFGGADLGDQRLTARLMQLGDVFYAKPLANVPQACGDYSGAKAAYRFFDNENVSMEAVLEPHYRASIQRVREQEVVLAVQDTSTINYTHHPMTKDLGPINTEKDQNIGLLLHDTMAFTPDGTPLGLLDVQCWAREETWSKSEERYQKPIEEKESFKWIKSYRSVSEIQRLCPNTRLIVVGDREADIHELFAEYAPGNADLLIRSEQSRNRCCETDDQIEHLWSHMRDKISSGTIGLCVPASPNRSARTAQLEIRFAAVTLKSPKRKPHLPHVPVYIVYAREVAAPEDIEALEWLLITTVAIENFDQALDALKWYARRWGIEVYHRVLKSGCRIEDRQLENARRLVNCLAIDMVVAWRIHHLTFLGRETPELPCSVFFEDSQWKALVCFIKRNPTPPSIPPTLGEAVRMVASLGGFLGRKSDKEPGTETIWRGLLRLDDITQSYIAFVLSPPQPTSAPMYPQTYG